MPKRKKSSPKHDQQSLSGSAVPWAPNLGVLTGAAIISLAAFLAYLPSLSGGFIFDDESVLINNPLIKASDGLYRIWCTTEPMDYWPVSYTTLWMEWRLWDMHSSGYHVTNLLLHIGASLLIWLSLRKLSMPGAFLAAAIFAVHPVNVESVAWIASRKNLMAMLFFLLSILFYLKFLKLAHLRFAAKHNLSTVHCPLSTFSSFILHPSSFHLWYWLSLAAFILATLSKGSVAILPILLLGIVWWRRQVTKWDLLRTAPFFLVAVLLAAVNVWFQKHGTGVEIRSASFIERLLGAGAVIWFYLYKAFLPLNLAFVYPQWQIQAGNLLWWLPLLAVVVVTAGLWQYRKGWSRPFLFAWGFFYVSLIPMLGFTDVGFMRYSLVADRYQHIALIGAIALAAAGWGLWHQQLAGLARWTAKAVAIVALGMLVILTRQQSGLYGDAMTLYQVTLEKNPDCALVHYNLGAVLIQAGRPGEAIEHYQQALLLQPNDAVAQHNLGFALIQAGQPQEAIEHFRQALRLKPDYLDARHNLSIALFKAGRPQEAIEHFQQVLELKPDFAEAYVNLMLAYAKTNQHAEALNTAQKALQLARSTGQTALAKQIEDWLNAYQGRGARDERRGKDE